MKWEETEIGVVRVKWLRWYLVGARGEREKNRTHNSIEANFVVVVAVVALWSKRILFCFVFNNKGWWKWDRRLSNNGYKYTFSPNGTSEMIFKINKKIAILGDACVMMFCFTLRWLRETQMMPLYYLKNSKIITY